MSSQNEENVAALPVSSIFEDHVTSQSYARERHSYSDDVFKVIIDYCRETTRDLDLAVDVGCGPGNSTVGFTKYFKQVLGVDISGSQIALAPKHIPNCEFRVGCATNLDFLPAASVDLFACGMAFFMMPQTKVFAEAERVLKPGGTLAIFGYGRIIFTDKEVDKIVEWMAGGGTERVIEEGVGGFIESKATRSSNEASGDKEMEQSGKIGSLDKSNDCSSREEKPKDIDTGVDGNQQSRDGSQDFEALEDLTKNLKMFETALRFSGNELREALELLPGVQLPYPGWIRLGVLVPYPGRIRKDDVHFSHQYTKDGILGVAKLLLRFMIANGHNDRDFVQTVEKRLTDLFHKRGLDCDHQVFDVRFHAVILLGHKPVKDGSFN
ncbi:trans-aconitate 2-methyltransferase [Elysia marginata]|uniref:Trans-aconitate 2-methyltransferase n=1 Tax=Elysia marginata TaxID=1093978 RepID=A0AAV4EQR8_9GAST|nr:trans-aconitate 2-methyltransferase [Elysia marginata]